MIKGQLVEIPANSPLYSRPIPAHMSKHEVLRWHSPNHKYSLFDGFLVGEHTGTDHFQLGQRKHIGVGGKKAPLYVIGIDEAENRVFVGEGENHPGLFSKVFCFKPSQFHPIENALIHHSFSEEQYPVEILFSNGVNAQAMIYYFEDGFFLEFAEPVPISLSTSKISVFKEDTLIATIF